MQKKLGRIVEVVPIADDRAVLWCENENELKYVLEKGDLFRGRLFIGKIQKWNMHMHWEFTQIEARHSWIGVEGLSLNLWNVETFKKIGDACGGLLEVAPETMNQSFLLYAKLKVKGFSSGFVYPIAEIPCEDEVIHVGLFSLGASTDKGVNMSGHMKGILAKSVGDSYLTMLKREVKDGKMRTMEEERRDEAMSKKLKLAEVVQKGTRSTKFVRRLESSFPATGVEGGAAVLIAEEEDGTMPKKIFSCAAKIEEIRDNRCIRA